MKCKHCGKQIIIFPDDSGAVRILNPPIRGFIELHICGNYGEVLSKYMIEKLGVEPKNYG